MYKSHLVSKLIGLSVFSVAVAIGMATNVSAVSVTNKYDVTGAGGHVIWLPNIDPQFKNNTALNLMLTEYSDGTAQLRGSAVDNAGAPTKGYDIYADFSGLLEPGDVGYAPSGSPKLEIAPPGGYDTSNWRYYTVVSGYIQGLGSFGSTYYLGRYGPSFQIGLGANLKGGAGLGASGWLALFASEADRANSGPLPGGSPDHSVKNGNYDHADFNLNLVNAPDSGTTLLFLGISLIGLAAIRRRTR